MKSLRLVLSLALVLCAGCNSSTPHPGPAPGQTAAVPRGHATSNDAPGAFDFYVFNLSWSPEFCATHPGNHECAARPGFIVHGLWPQNSNGTFPENCSNPTRLTNPAAYLDLMPTISLIQHEWSTHGTCSGLSPEDYFTGIRTALRSVEIPATFAADVNPPATMRPQILLAQFSRDNPTFPPSSFALSCGNNFLTAVEVCMDKGLRPIPCQGIRSCRANQVKITPR